MPKIEEDFDTVIDKLEQGDKKDKAIAFALQHGQTDGTHHKAWVIDQVLRILAGDKYDKLIELYEVSDEYEWDPGIAP